MRRIILFFSLLIVCGFTTKAHDPVHFDISIRIMDQDENQPLSKASVEVHRDGEKLSSYSTNETGQIIIEDLEVWGFYTLYFKKDSYVTKTASINAREYYYDTEDAPGLSWEFEVGLFKSSDLNFDYLESQPTICFFFNYLGFQDWDKDYLNKMKLKIDLTKHNLDTTYLDSAALFMRDARNWEKWGYIDSAITCLKNAHNIYPVPFLDHEIEKKEAKATDMRVEFNSFVAIADSLLKMGKHSVEALDTYLLADKIFRQNEYVEQKIAELNTLIFGSAKPSSRSKRDFDGMHGFYYELRLAYTLYENGEYDAALKHYEDAIEHYWDSEYVNQKITEIKTLLNKE